MKFAAELRRLAAKVVLSERCVIIPSPKANETLKR
jgi:hypothetical protein